MTRTPPTETTGTAAPEVPELPTAPPAHPDPMVEAATALTLPFTLVRQLLPASPVPVALGASALALAGVIEWPAAAAVGLGYVALRRWLGPRPVVPRAG